MNSININTYASVLCADTQMGVATLSISKVANAMENNEPRTVMSIEQEIAREMLRMYEDIFDKCNKFYFGGKLKKPKFRVAKKGNFIARVSLHDSKWEIRNGKIFFIKKAKPTLEINMRYYGYNEDFYKGAMIHEMVHLWIFAHYSYNVPAHGKEFKAYCNKLKHDYGIIITTYHNDEPIPPYPDEDLIPRQDVANSLKKITIEKCVA